MPAFLEDAVNPQLVCWLAENLACVSAASKASLFADLSQKVATFVARENLFAREVYTLLAHLSPLPRAGAAPFRVSRHLLIQRTSPAVTDNLVRDIEHTIRTGTSDSNVFRMYAYTFVAKTFASRPQTTTDAVPRNTGVEGDRLRRLMVGFARETTFKVHGDASLHAEIITFTLPLFMVCMLAHLETPYQLVASVYHNQVNSMVRPLLETPIRTRLDDVRWQGPHTVRDVVLVMCLLIELVGQRKIAMVTAARLTSTSSAVPLPFVLRGRDGIARAGVVTSGSYSTFAPALSVCDIAVRWLELCENDDVAGTFDVREAVLNELSDVNPLCKYLVRQQPN